MNENLSAEVSTGKRKILIVEDNELNREVLKAILSYDYTFYEAENGRIGIELLQEHYQDLSLVVLDVYMPEMDGFEFLSVVKADPLLKNIPVLVATGSTSEAVEERCLALGAADFITKPYRPNIVRSRIKSIITLRESAAVLSAVEYDELTGVYTKQAFIHHAGVLLKRNPEKHYSLIVSDIDDFKTINEKYGEDYGNRLLVHGASFIKPAMDHGIPVGRYGGDQFVSLMEYDPSVTNTELLMSIINGLKASFPVPGLEMRMGIYDDVDHDLPVSVLCDRAIIAVRSINHQYGKYIAYYDDALRKSIELEQKLELDMKRAYDEGQFKVYYQPKHDTQSGALVGAEALIRWIHPEMGFLPPSEFIPLFEKNGFITYADYFVWKKTCEDQRKWLDRGLKIVPISVNTSRRDYDYPNYIEMILEPVRKYGLDPSMLHIEVTESLFSSNLEELCRKVQACRDAGFKIEMDDFGSGYSSLNMLGTLPLDVLKFDMSFMRQLGNEKKAKVFSSCISMARSLGLYTVAEGVETEEQRTLLKALRCNSIQGYYFSRPLPEGEFEQYLAVCADRKENGKAISRDNDFDSGMYLIDEDYRVLMINDVIKQTYPQMRTGEFCYRSLMNLDEPCAICPVKNGVQGVQTYLDPLRGVYETVQVVKVPLPEEKTGYALVLCTLT